MKAKRIIAMAVLLALTLTCCLVACKPQLTDEPLKGEIVADFTKGESESVFESDGWSNGSVFNVVWDKNNVEYGEDAMHLGIKAEERTVWVDDAEKTYSYTAGEARTTLHYGYGDFEVSMKPAKKAGTASTFFTCTGPYDTGLDGEPQKHDEIDIEFLGKDTTKVQFNYFVNGQGGHEHMYNLGFDASKEYHTYGFRWTKDYIVWFVDGKPVYKVEASEKNVLPSAPGRMLMNYWCGTKDAEGWMGKYSIGNETADYQWIKTSATGVDLTPSVDVPGEGFTGDWSTIEASDITFTASNEKYTVAKTNGVTNITYTDVLGNEYINVNAPITQTATEKNWLHLTLTNNADTDVQVRVNVIDDALANAEKNKSTNIAAYMDGEAVFTDLEWGGSFFNIPAKTTVEAEVNFGGTPDTLELMIDSSRNDGASRAGDVSVSNVKFAKQGDIAGVEPTPSVPGEHPTSGDLTLMVNDTELTFAGNVADGYGVNANDAEATLNVKYNAITGASYKNIWAAASSIARAHNVFSVQITNNGSESVTVRIDIESETNKGNTTACNVSATQDGEGVYTDLEWGGSTFTVAAGATVLAEVTYDTAANPTNVKFFFDSSVYDDTGVHSGDVTLSEMAFTGEGGDLPPVGPGYELGKEYAPTSTEIVNSGKNDAARKDDAWMLWWVQGADWNCGTVVTMQAGWNSYNDGVSFTYSGGDRNFSVQLFYNNTSLILNKQYVIKCAIEASTAMDVTVNGKVISLAAGNNDIEVLFTNGIATDGGPMYAVDIQFWGTSQEVSFSIKNVKWYEISTEEYPSTPGGDETPSEIPTHGWTDIECWGFGYWGSGYTVERASNGMTISHSEAMNGYKCEGMGISNYGWIKFTITNNGTGIAQVRIDVKKENPSTQGVEAVYCQTEGAASLNDYDSSVSITLAAGQSVEVALKISNDVAVDQFVVFLNSMQESGGIEAGSITISDLKGIVK